MKLNLKDILVLGGVWFIVLALASCGDEPSFSNKKIEIKENDSIHGESDATVTGIDDSSASGEAGNETSSQAGSTTNRGNSSTSGSETTNGSTPIIPGSATGSDITKLCTEHATRVEVFPVSFERRENCSWSQNGNLSKKDGYIRARESQSVTRNIDDMSLVCGVNLVSKTSQIHFDDLFSLNVNGVVVAGSKALVDSLTTDSTNLKVWDWSRAVNTRLQDLGKYCLGGECELPEHDQQGAFSVDLKFDAIDNSSILSSLMAKIKNDRQIKIEAIATGDNDSGDCFHSGGEFDLELTVVDM